ncbi:MAG: transcription-repair coupling factor [Gammaproteobacteria bacterium]
MDNPVSPLRPLLPEQPGERRYWGGLYGSSKALAIREAAGLIQGPVLVIAPDPNAVQRLYEGLRFFGAGDDDIPLMSFPDWETLPYDLFSPYQDIISERLSTLAQLPDLQRGVLVASISTVMHRLLPREYLCANSLILSTGQQLDPERFRLQLSESGYRFVSQVMEHGDVAIRGSLLDIYPMGSAWPLRIDLFDTEIDSIRLFDPESQLTRETTDSIRILPAREFGLDAAAVNRFRANWRERFSGNPAASIIYRDVSEGLAPAGIEYYLPLFYEQTDSIFDYMNSGGLVILDEGVQEAAETFWEDTCERYRQRCENIERPLLKPQEIFYPIEEFLQHAGKFPQVYSRALARNDDRAGTVNFAAGTPTRIPVDSRAGEPLGLLKRFIENFHGRILLVAESAGRRETILELLRKNDLQPALFSDWHEFLNGNASLGLTVAPLEEGALLHEPRIAVISETQLFGERVQQRRLRKRRQTDAEAVVRNLTELTTGAPVVHEEHGVGRYLGLANLEVGDVPAEFICLEYDKGDKLYVPVSSLDRISRYTGMDPEHAPLHRLGSGQWEKARRKAQERVYDVAAELLELHARRAARDGYSFQVDEDAYQSFAQAFPFEETPGQMDAINDVLKDLRSNRPMDRLICGDSGFGKTEVAMRAAFITVNNNRQVALLVPTTLLAQQHYQNFKDRFADWPVRVEVLSRFVDRKKTTEVLRGLSEGKVDIIIGTHKLLQDDIRFERLGLVIIDEEHRFGVRQKEKFKSLRAEVDVLTLTATPIPRTLNMALSDMRDLSIIASPPSRRLAVKTFINEWNDALLKEAMLREIKRGGQVYFLHNKVETINSKAEEIEALVPEARVRIAHGQLPEKELEQIMFDFYHRRFNILVCSTIIETGIDVPNANTIIINRADKFGLAQLYQLRGRVGRSHHRAYAYLVVPPQRAMTKDAIKRLEAIESLEELGIGFTLATHDLEIRGAGEILGEDQSGQIQEIGFGLYMDMLDRAVKALKSGKQPQLDRPLDHGTDVDLHMSALIPEDYLPDVQARLIMYKRIASAADEQELESLQEEMIDRFGMLPEPIRNLFAVTRLKQQAAPLGIRKIDLGEKGGRLLFHEKTRVDPSRIIELIRENPAVYKLDGSDKLRISREMPQASDRIQALTDLFEAIAMRQAA